MGVDTGRLRVVSAEAAAVDGSAESGSSLALRVRRDSLESEVPETFETPGPYIRAQRMRRGLSLDQLAAQTKIPKGQLELLEADRFEELPGMVFAKGFLRCCARALELEEDTVLGLLYERERAALRLRRREGSSATGPDPRQVLRPDARANHKKRAKQSPLQVAVERARDYVSAWLGELPSARIVLWVVVALFVALVVYIAFTLASGQAESVMIRS